MTKFITTVAIFAVVAFVAATTNFAIAIWDNQVASDRCGVHQAARRGMEKDHRDRYRETGVLPGAVERAEYRATESALEGAYRHLRETDRDAVLAFRLWVVTLVALWLAVTYYVTRVPPYVVETYDEASR